MGHLTEIYEENFGLVFKYLMTLCRNTDVAEELTLNAAGQEQLKEFWNKWEFINSKINKLKINGMEGEK